MCVRERDRQRERERERVSGYGGGAERFKSVCHVFRNINYLLGLLRNDQKSLAEQTTHNS